MASEISICAVRVMDADPITQVRVAVVSMTVTAEQPVIKTHSGASGGTFITKSRCRPWAGVRSLRTGAQELGMGPEFSIM